MMYGSKKQLRKDLGLFKYWWIVLKANLLCVVVVEVLKIAKFLPFIIREFNDDNVYDHTYFTVFGITYSCCGQMFWSDYYQAVIKSTRVGFHLLDIDKTWAWKDLKPGSLFSEISKLKIETIRKR